MDSLASQGASKRNYNNLEMAVLHQISRVLVHKTNVNQLLKDVLQILNSEMGLLRGTVTLRQGDLLFIEASHGMTLEEIKRGVYRIGEGVTGQVAAHAKSRIIPDISSSTEFLNRTKTRQAGKNIAFICVPFIYQEQVIGTLSIDRIVSSDTNLRRDLSLLETIANIMADAVSVLFLKNQERDQLLEENRRLRIELSDKIVRGGIVGKCNSMQKVLSDIAHLSSSDTPVLIRGESGTGKKLAANAIVANSSRKDRPFASINCVAMPDAAIANELFGYEKGAFASASSRKLGLLESAAGGTIFIDKIGDISMENQLKLLRYLQEKTFYRSGGARMLHSDVRIIAASGKNLEEMVSLGTFREDLYLLLNSFTIHLPALRDRRSDITLLAEHFLAKFSKKHKKQVKRISTPAINMLMNYFWPGNVRELENCIESAVLSAADQVIYGYNLPATLQTAQSAQGSSALSDEACKDFTSCVRSFERELLSEALKNCRGNASAAARYLGISQRIMNYKIKNLAIDASLYKKLAKRGKTKRS